MAGYSVGLEFNVKGYSEVNSATAALERLQDAHKKVQRQATGVQSSLQQLQAAHRASGAAARIGAAGMQAFGAAITSALGPIALVTTAVAGLGKIISITSDRQKDVATLSQGLKNLGDTGTRNLNALQDAADRLGKQTLFDQEQFTQGFALLTSFRNIGVSSYERVATAAADMAQVTGQDVNSAFMQLAKALENPAEQMTALSRSGTTFTATQKEMIQSLIASGQQFQAQQAILEVVEQQYSGAATAAGSAGFAGAMDSLGEASRDFAETAGSVLLPILTEWVKAFTAGLQKINEMIKGVISAGKSFASFALGVADATGSFLGFNTEGLKAAKAALDAGNAAKDAAQGTEDLANTQGDAAMTAQEMAAAQKEAAAALREIQQATQAQGQAETTSIDHRLAVTQQLIAAEQEIINAKRTQAQADLNSAATQAAKEAAAQRIYELAVQAADLDYKAAQAASQAAIAKAQSAADQARVMQSLVSLELKRAEAAGKVTAAHREAAAEAAKGLQIAQQAVAREQELQQAVMGTAGAKKAAATAAAEAARATATITQEATRASGAARQVAAGFREAAAAASSAASAASSIGGGGGGGQAVGGVQTSAYLANKKFIDTKVLDENGKIRDITQKEYERQYNALRLQGWKGGIFRYNPLANTSREQAAFDLDYLRLGNTRWNALMTARYGGMMGPLGSLKERMVAEILGPRAGLSFYSSQGSTHTYAEGGYVTGPQQAIVGEGGEPEYIIPASKMQAAMERYGAGQRGDAVIPKSANVNVNYGGSVVNMNGGNYIQQSDVNGIVSKAVNQTLGTLRKNSSARQYAGVGR